MHVIRGADHHWGYHDLASADYPRAIRAAKEELELAADCPTFLFTHSMGGQVGAMFLARPEAQELNVKGLMGVGLGSPYHRGFTGKDHARALVGGQLMGQVAKLRGFWPGGAFEIAGYGRQSGTHVYECSRFSRENRIDNLAGQDIDYSRDSRNVRTPVFLAVSYTHLTLPTTARRCRSRWSPYH